MSPTERLAAALADRYRIERQLGAGGMATVYLAHDLRHDRKVALKVLRPELAAVIGADRFLQEIKTTANLHHPHILPLFDSGEADSFLYYVMPYVDGESLRERLEREKQLPTAEAVRVAAEAADALDYAHRRAIIHRDIKPENILLHDGRAMIADFGIALALRAAGGDRLTETGLSLGTPQYMSPEQAMADRELDARTDIYSLGCVLYEMLAGEPPYTGGTAQAIVGRLLTEEPRRLSTVRRTVPAQVEAAVHKALEKLPADRFGDAAEFGEALTNPAAAVASKITTVGAPAGATVGGPRLVPAIALVAAAVVAGIAIGWFARSTPVPVARRTSFYYEPDSTHTLSLYCCGGMLAISRDGRRIAYVGTEHGQTPTVYVRGMGELRPRPLPASTDARSLAFSPDGEWIVFAGRTAWNKIAVAGGAPIELAQLEGDPYGATWTDDNTIVYASSGSGGLLRVSSNGGVPERLTEPDRAAGVAAHSTPYHVPGTDLVLFTFVPASRDWNEVRIGAVSLKTGEVLQVSRGLNPRYTSSGHLVVALPGGAVVAQALDLKSLQTSGPLTYLAESVFTAVLGWADFVISESGALVYVPGTSQPVVEQVDRMGTARALPFQVENAAHFDSPRLSPDGTRLALSSSIDGTHRVYVFDLERGTGLRLTFDGNNERVEWTPDGDSIIFAPDYRGFSVRAADRSGEERVLLPPGENEIGEFSVSRSHIAFVVENDYTTRNIAASQLGQRKTAPGARLKTGADILVALRDSLSAARPYAATPFDEAAPAISPDERWLAYTSDETGQDEVYIASFPTPGGPQVVSIGGGSAPVWGKDGRTLYYLDSTGQLIAADVQTNPGFAVKNRTTLFASDYETQAGATEYDVHPAGEHFVMLRSRTSGSRLVVVLNALADPGSERGSDGR